MSSQNPILKTLGSVALDRRALLQRSLCLGAAVAASRFACVGPAEAATSDNVQGDPRDRPLQLPVFHRQGAGFGEADGVALDFVTTPTNADIAALFVAGIVEVRWCPTRTS